MTTCNPTPELLAALAAAQGEFPPVAKTRTAKVASSKGAYSYDYADLSDVLAAVTPALARHGLAVTHRTEPADGYLLLHCELWHASGGVLRSTLPLDPPGGGRWQDWGSAMSYSRRYTLCALLGIQAEAEDDDAQAASRPHKPQAQPQQRPAPAQPTVEGVEAAIAAARDESEVAAVVAQHRAWVQSLGKPDQDRLAGAKRAKLRTLQPNLEQPFAA
jgi:hypothetical protein